MTEEKTKLCSKCRKRKPLEEFNKRVASPDGLSYKCRECENAVVKANYFKRKKRLGKNLYYEQHKEEIRQKSKAYYEANKEHLLEKNKEYRTKKPQVHARSVEKRKLLILKQKGKPYTRGMIIKRDSQLIGEKLVPICQICMKPIEDLNELQIDHIIPIGKGGLDCYDNVRICHAKCNITRPLDGRDLEEGIVSKQIAKRVKQDVEDKFKPNSLERK